MQKSATPLHTSTLRGFTLIELLITIGILSVLSGIGFAAFREFDRRQQLTQAASTVRQDLRLVEQKALAAEKPAGCTDTLLGWKVSFSGSSYLLIADCDSTDVNLKTVNLPSGITANSISVTFKVLAQGTTSPGDDTITLSQSGMGATATITVTTGGSIY